MVLKTRVENLKPKELKKLLLNVGSRIYKTRSELIYKGHIPLAGFILIEGAIDIMQGKKLVGSIVPGQLLGLNEALNHIPFKYQAIIEANSEVIILDQSTLKELSHELTEIVAN